MYFFLGILLVGAAHCAPNHVKYVEKGVAGGAAVGEGGASASWGPFSASAGIGGSNGLAHAGASTGAGAGAGAGIGGGSSSASASASTGAGAGFFDSIFNIPISVLQSVNKHLNNKDTQDALAMRRAFKQCKRHGNCKALEVLQGGAGAGAGVSASAGASAGAQSDVLSRGAFSAEAGASTGSSHIGTVGGHKNYDSTFAIPIAALSSVNDFLNGKGK